MVLLRYPDRSGHVLRPGTACRISVRPASAEDAFELAPFLGYLDLLEVAIYDMSPLDTLLAPFAAGYGEQTWAGEMDGKCVAMFGVVPHNGNAAYVWLLADDILREHPIPVLRKMRQELDRLNDIRPVLWSACYDDPERLRLLRILGFDIGKQFRHSSGAPLVNIYRRRKAAQGNVHRPANAAHSLCILKA